jgi:hypothetical protein
MRTTLIALLMLAPLALPGAHALPPPPLTMVHVTLQIDASAYPLLPETKTCGVDVPPGSDGKVMLTAATLSGCIAGWSATFSPTVGAFFLDSVDAHRAFCDPGVDFVHCTFWALSVNGADSQTGIDGWRASDGDTYGFTYDREFAGLPSPVP